MNISINKFNSTYHVTEAYPSLKEPESYVFLIAGIYLLSFIVGICGNASTLTLIFNFGTLKSKLATKVQHAAHDRFKIYVGCLCLVDSLMLLSLPTAIVDSLIGFWIFGNIACKFHHFCSTVGRLASTLIITALSIERYLAVVSPQRFGNRSNRTTGLVMLLMLSLASILLLPLIIFAEAKPTFLFESRKGNQIVHVRIFKCVDSMPMTLLFWFTGSTFFVGYLFPIIVIAIFNVKLLMQIRRHQRKISTKSIIPMKRVTTYIVIIALFYFLCWTPYWTGVIYVSYVDIFETRAIKTLTNKSEQTMFLLYCAHIFPYLNTAVNWLLYGQLARSLITQQSYSRLQPMTDNSTQSELSWTRRQTFDENSTYFRSSPAQLLLRSTPSDSSDTIKLANDSYRHESENRDENVKRFLARYGREIESFEIL